MTHTIISHRLKAEMQKQGINSSELARRSEVLTSFIYDVISGKSANPSTVKLARVARALGIGLNDLVSAPESNVVTFYPATETQGYATIPPLSAQEGAHYGSLMSSGFFHFQKDWIRTQLHTSAEFLRIMLVSDDTMEPTLRRQDSVLVDISQTTPSPPGMFVVHDGVTAVIKRLEHTEEDGQGVVRVLSDNPRYSSYARSIEEIAILGRVVWFARAI
jgi:phage repressor protein C with HTH and peptisase S24 domain